MNKRAYILIFLFFLLFLPGGALWSQNQRVSQDLPTRRIEDDSSLRTALEASWFKESPAKVVSMRPEIHTLGGGSRIQVRIETGQNREEFAVVLAREQNGAFPGWAQGSWVLTRRRDNSGAALQIRVFLRSDYNTYVQFRPFTDEKSYMDVVLYDAYLIRSLPIPVPFDRLLTLPVEDALSLAGNQFPRRYFDPESGAYRDSRAFIAAVRAKLPGLEYQDDGAMDENGDYVFIDTLAPQDAFAQGLNCSGFAKWIVDGIINAAGGKKLAITPLKMPFGNRGSSFTEPWESLRDPYFGLDWCRNLAGAAWTTLRSPAFAELPEIEVRDWPFSELIERQNRGSTLRSYPGFVSNAGFPFEGLSSLLYSLAINEPGRIYLAAVNDELGAPVTPDNPRGLPRFRQYYHIAVLVPYFNERGVFQVAVFESAAETSFTRFSSRYPGQFVNLARVPIEGSFEP